MTINTEKSAENSYRGVNKTISIIGENNTSMLSDFVTSIAKKYGNNYMSFCMHFGNSSTFSQKQLAQVTL
jgi:hypothetical protein